jgi:hypothetical protein
MPDEQPVRVELEAVTSAAFSGVLRALEARQLAPERFPGPILVGIIAWPELSQFKERFAAGAADASASGESSG